MTNGGGAVNQFNDDAVTFLWSEGPPAASATNTKNGVYGSLAGGFQFTVPAGTAARQVKVCVGGYNASGTFAATLSDGSAPDYTDSSAGAGALGNTDGAHFYAVYTVNYKAASASQTLTISWNQSAGNGNVTLAAATLATPPAAPPAAPTLTATAGDNRVGLTWGSVTGADSYNIKRSLTANGPFTTIGASLTPGYQDTTAVNGTTYYYEVTAVNRVGEGSPSNVASAKPQAGIDGAGLTGKYWDNATANVGYGPNFNYAAAPAPTVTEVDPTINFNVDVNPPAGVPHDNFNAEWTGPVKAQAAGDYVFTTTSDDGSRVFIDGVQVVNNYQYQAANTVSSAPVTFTAGSTHTVRIDYFQGGGGGLMQFLWSYPGQAQQIVPAYALFPTFGSAVPLAPTLTGTAGDAQAFLSFTLADAATSYTVLRGSSLTGPFTPIATGISGPGYTDTGLTNGTIYFYVVRAVNANGSSPNSNVVAIAPSASASLIAEEQFNYPAGPLNSLNGGTGWSGPWTANNDTVAVAGLSFPGLSTAGGTLVTSPNGDAAFRSLSQRLGSYLGTGTVYLSYISAVDPANTGAFGPGSANYNGLSLFDDGSENYFSGLGYEGATYTGNVGDTKITVDKTPRLFVFKFDFTASGVTVSEYVDPTSGASLPATPTVTGTVGPFSFNRIRVGNGNATPATSLDYDEIRIGRTYASVTPASVTGATLTGKIALEGVANLGAINPAAPLGVFHVSLRQNGVEVKKANVTLTTSVGSAVGTFTLSGVAAGTYDLWVKGKKNLAVLTPGVVVSSTGGILGTNANPITLPAADSNNDNSVDSSDFTALIGAFNSDAAVAGSGYDPTADFNFDGFVDSSDFTLLIGQFNNVGPN